MSVRGAPLLTLLGFFIVVILLCPNVVLARAPKMLSENVSDAKAATGNTSLNVIDACWRKPNWMNDRQNLAKCSVGFAGKMINNVGKGIKKYVVTDPSDHPTSPKPGTLRYGATMIKGKVWITFQKSMTLKLVMPLYVSSYTAIDGRGFDVHISNGAGIVLQQVNNVIIHSLSIHHIVPTPQGKIIGPEGIFVEGTAAGDGDAVRVLSSSKVWIDHNTMSECPDGLIDVTRASTNVTISNNRFSKQNKVILLGHSDALKEDQRMRVTLAFNHFGPGCYQRMPRVRNGYAHVVNNLYLGWGLYAIGGSANPRITSQANLFHALGKKEVTWKANYKKGDAGCIQSVGDVLENGAVFSEAKKVKCAKPNYTAEQDFPVAQAGSMRTLTKNAGVLKSK